MIWLNLIKQDSNVHILVWETRRPQVSPWGSRWVMWSKHAANTSQVTRAAPACTGGSRLHIWRWKLLQTLSGSNCSNKTPHKVQFVFLLSCWGLKHLSFRQDIWSNHTFAWWFPTEVCENKWKQKAAVNKRPRNLKMCEFKRKSRYKSDYK